LELEQAAVSGLLLGLVYALVATGLTLIFGVMRFVNFAHGEFLMVGMYTTFFAWLFLGLDPLVSVPLAAAAVAVLGVATYLILIRPVLHGTLFSQTVVTFGLLIFLRGVAQLVFTAQTRSVLHPAVEALRIELAGVVAGGPQLLAGLGAAVCISVLWWFLNRTELGVAVRAVAQDSAAAELMGIDPLRIHILTWAISGAMVGIAGALLMTFYPVTPLVGLIFSAPALVIIALGGLGSLAGALLAGLLMGLVQTMVGLFFPAYAVLALFLLYFAIIQVRPYGLANRA
jgi:branched-chain amino acid transport system permease protein